MTTMTDFVETPIAPDSGTEGRSHREPMPVPADGREVVKRMAIGSPRAVENTIRVLYLRGFAELYEWSPMQPTQNPGEVMSLMRWWVVLG
ncbi:MAG: peptide ABC transporter substrate-binding protein [Oscillatoriales cyanobacterium]|nr:MAG: peptide ABC transporter substrate-binding protein [Oscillatoriales cyanobacterium]